MISPANQQLCTFSVIMPCYNSEAYVRNALESICNQTYSNWELVAVNDGSTDSTLQILQQYAQGDPRIKIFSKENGGYVSAVNYGLENITGDYFLLLGSDDALDTHLFDQLNQEALSAFPDCMAFRTQIVQDGVITGDDSLTAFHTAVRTTDTTFAQFSLAYPEHSEIFTGRDTSKCFKKAILGDIRYLGKYGFDADGIFSMMISHQASSFSVLPAIGYYWTHRSDSLSARKSFLARDLDRIQNWISFFEYLQTLPKEEITPAEKRYIYYFIQLLKDSWSEQIPFYQGSRLVRKASKTICEMSHYADFKLSVSKSAALLLAVPLCWKTIYLLLRKFHIKLP